jgi:gluconolactonase
MTSTQYQIDDDRFRYLIVVSSRLDTLYTRCRWAEWPVWFNDLGTPPQARSANKG